jgi:hypothetical protein
MYITLKYSEVIDLLVDNSTVWEAKFTVFLLTPVTYLHSSRWIWRDSCFWLSVRVSSESMNIWPKLLSSGHCCQGSTNHTLLGAKGECSTAAHLTLECYSYDSVEREILVAVVGFKRKTTEKNGKGLHLRLPFFWALPSNGVGSPFPAGL